MQLFQNDDARYLAWYAAHPQGYIINTHNPPNGKYQSLHRADCKSLHPNNPNNKEYTVLYAKVCSEKRQELEEWAISTLGSPTTICGQCQRTGRL